MAIDTFPEDLTRTLDEYANLSGQEKRAKALLDAFNIRIQLLIEQMDCGASLDAVLSSSYEQALRNLRKAVSKNLNYGKEPTSQRMLDISLFTLFCAGLLEGPLGAERGLRRLVEQATISLIKPNE